MELTQSFTVRPTMQRGLYLVLFSELVQLSPPDKLVDCYAMQCSSNLVRSECQPRTQALSTTRLAGGKTLVQAGHVSPRFWEITKFLYKGGGISFILPI
jgi:hypothetical protein